MAASYFSRKKYDARNLAKKNFCEKSFAKRALTQSRPSAIIFASNLLGGTYEKVHKNIKSLWGGVLVLSAILSLSLTLASCDNNSDSDDGDPSPALPENVGENPVKKTVKLKNDRRSRYSLKLRTDGTADYIYEDDDKDDYGTYSKFRYTWNEDTNTIYMRMEKMVCAFDDLMYLAGATDLDELLTYDEARSKINEYYTVKKLREGLKKLYEEDKEYYEEEYPDCHSYEDFEAEIVKDLWDFNSIDDVVKYCKRQAESYCKSSFGARITFSYKITDGKMTLAEKFTGLKNLFFSNFYGNSNNEYLYVEIGGSYAGVNTRKNDVRYDYAGILDTDNNAIDFVKRKVSKTDSHEYEYLGNVNGSYTENISGKTVTIKCEGEEYVCEFKGQKFVQE